MCLKLRTFGNPLPQNLNVSWLNGMLGAMLRRRHLLLGIKGSETCDHLTFIRFSRHDAVRTAFQRLQREFSAGEHEAAFGIIRAVAFETVLGKERLNVAGKINRRSVGDRCGKKERGKTKSRHTA
jgi:hypothetical protein